MPPAGPPSNNRDHQPGARRADLGLGDSALAVLAERYLRRDLSGTVIETPRQMMQRVAAAVAQAEDAFAPGAASEWAERFAEMLTRLELVPNSPTLMNAGTPVGMLSACFVLPVEDSLRAIFDTLGDAGLIHQAGGGTGFSFSRLRPRGDPLATTGGQSSGPVSFLELFDTATRVIQQTGRRRGANMAVLDVAHPDIGEFVTAKADPEALTTFNLSVGVTDAFMHAARSDDDHDLVSPRDGRRVGSVPAAALLDLICRRAWAGGDPGLLFLDAINRANPLPDAGRIEATNPCGEVPLSPNESCTLGSLNLTAFVDGERGDVRWDALADAVGLGVRFLDDVVEINRYPTPATEAAAHATRKIGLGVMGLADVFASLGLPYGSSGSIALAERILDHIAVHAQRASTDLALQRGAFPRFDHSVFAHRGLPPRRNAQLLAVAPTGTISMIAGVTSGIEPIFAVAYERSVLDRPVLELNPIFTRLADDQGFASPDLFAEIAATGSIQDNPAVPEPVRRVFLTALDLDPHAHVAIQAAVQRHVDASVAKTVNLPHHATVEDIRSIYLAAWELGVKGVTVYRDRSRPHQVLHRPANGNRLRAEATYSGGCAARACTF